MLGFCCRRVVFFEVLVFLFICKDGGCEELDTVSLYCLCCGVVSRCFCWDCCCFSSVCRRFWVFSCCLFSWVICKVRFICLFCWGWIVFWIRGVGLGIFIWVGWFFVDLLFCDVVFWVFIDFFGFWRMLILDWIGCLWFFFLEDIFIFCMILFLVGIGIWEDLGCFKLEIFRWFCCCKFFLW